MTFILFQRDLRMLHGEREVFLREIEHIEDGILLAEVLTMMDGAYHLDNGLAFMHHLLLAIQSDDGEFALYEHTVVHHGMMMPATMPVSLRLRSVRLNGAKPATTSSP